MKILNTSFILLLCFIRAFAQEELPDYRRFEVLGKKINDIQRTAEGKIFNSGKGESTIGGSVN